MFLYNPFKMSVSLKFKKVWIWSEGEGVSIFSNKSEIQKSLNYSDLGVGVKPNSDFVLKFLRFLIMTPLLGSKENVVIDH